MTNLSLLALFLLTQAPGAPRMGTISGSVFVGEQKPAVHVRVGAMLLLEGISTNNGSAMLALAQSDEAGHYRLENVPPGRYYISAGGVSPPTYYPGVGAVSAATIVTVAAGSEINGLDFVVSEESRIATLSAAQTNTLQQIRLAMVGARAAGLDELRKMEASVLSNPDSSSMNPGNSGAGSVALPVKGQVKVEAGALPQFGGRGSVVFRRTTDDYMVRGNVKADGAFDLAIVDGDYEVSVTLPRGYEVKELAAGSLSLMSTHLRIDRTRTVPDIRITLVQTVPRLSVRGRVVDEDSGKPVAEGAGSISSANGRQSQTVNIGADGSFEFTDLVPDSYTITIQVFGHRHVSRTVEIGTTNVTLDIPTTRMY